MPLLDSVQAKLHHDKQCPPGFGWQWPTGRVAAHAALPVQVLLQRPAAASGTCCRPCGALRYRLAPCPAYTKVLCRHAHISQQVEIVAVCPASLACKISACMHPTCPACGAHHHAPRHARCVWQSCVSASAGPPARCGCRYEEEADATAACVGVPSWSTCRGAAAVCPMLCTPQPP